MKDLKHLNVSFKKLVIFGSACIAFTLTSIFMQNNYVSKGQKISALNTGVGTCFTRVNQSFTALMIQDLSSAYLQEAFLGTTLDCFNVANSEFTAIWATSFKEGNKYMTQLVSDLHWFNEKIQKLQKMVVEGGISLTNSNIINKYTTLEAAKNSFADASEKQLEGAKTWANIWFGATFFGFTTFIAVIAIFGIQQKNNREVFNHFENEVENNEVTAATLDRILENVFNKLEMPKTYQAVNAYYSNLLEKQYALFERNDNTSSNEKAEITNDTQNTKVPTANFQDALSTVLDGVQTKAFTHGIMIHTDLDDDFMVKGDQETLEQFLYNVVNYATENSLHHNEGRKVTLSGKPLGGTAYLKVGISNYCFNADELNYLNANDESGSNINMNLILMKELMNDIGATIAVKNKMTAEKNIEGCEMEIIFQRVKTETAEKSITIVKGKKKDILKSLSANA